MRAHFAGPSQGSGWFSHRGLAAFVALFALAFAATSQAPAATPHHLYVALRHVHNLTGKIVRFTLVNGLPQQRPDLTIPNMYAPITVSHDGSLYAILPEGSSFFTDTIGTFPLGATQPTRTVSLPDVNDFVYATAIAVGPSGYIYVGYGSYISGAIPNLAGDDAFDTRSVPLHGIAVFAPNAKFAHPVYKFYGIADGPTWMQMGPENELYVAGFQRNAPNPGHIFTLTQPWAGPNIRQQLDTGFNALGIAFADETTDMYVLAAGGTLSSIDVYHRGAHGQDKPYRSFTVAYTFSPSLAPVGKNLFMTSLDHVLAYPKVSTGSPNPVVSRSFPGYYVMGVAAGP